MTQAIAQSNVAEMPQHSLIVTMAANYGLERGKFLDTLKKTIFPSDRVATNEQIAAFLVVANKYGLNPFTKEIYAFPGKGGGITPIVSIDGWLSLINRQPDLDGVEFVDRLDDSGKLLAVTAKVYRKSRAHATEVTEYMSECARNTDPWKQYPARMLRHKAMIQAARYAFGFAGVHDPDEAERIAESEANGNGNGGHIADKTRERVEEMKARYTPPEPVSDDVVEPDAIEAEIIEENASVEDQMAEVAEELREADEIERSIESQLEDLKVSAKDKINQLTGGEARAVGNLLNGRTPNTMDLKQIKAFHKELDKLIDAQG